MTTISTEFALALAGNAPRIGVFFRLMLDTPIRLWLGIGDCEAGIDATDGAGATYSGLGELRNVPAFQQMVNGTADRIDFKLSGVSQRVATMASTEATDVKGVALNIGLGVFDDDWQLIDNPVWLRRLIVDFLSVDFAQDGEGLLYTVGLSARSIFTGRRRPGLSFFTDAEQQSRSAGDKFCEHTTRYQQNVDKVWPRF